jgi:predicted ATP-dependent protease
MDAENGGREAIERYRVAPSLMRLALPVEFPASTESVEPLRDVAGQARAQEAIRFGLAIEAEGYNIAISGQPASGRSMIAKNLLGEVAAARPTPHDWVYLYNFTDPRRPKAAALPAGASAGLERGLATLARVCKEELPRAFDSEAYAKKAQETIEPFSRQREAVLQSLERAARQQGFLLNSTPMGIVPVAARPDGTPLTQEEFDALPPDQREQLEQRGVQVQEAVGSALRQARHFEAQATDAVEAVDGEITRFILGPVLDDLRKQFATDGLAEHLAAVESDIVSNLGVFKRFTEGFSEGAPPQVVAELTAVREQLLRRYGVNVLVRHATPGAGAPVHFEKHPSFANLFGRVEFENRMGTMVSDFMHVRPGALHLANGGFLVINLPDLLTEPRSWQSLKRALKTHEVRVADGPETWLPFPVIDLAPEGIPLELKVVLIGEPQMFVLLDLLDDEFGALFKIRAELEPDVDATPETMLAYAAFVRRTRDDLRLRHFTSEALNEIVRYGSRLADRHDRLTTRYGLIADLCVEANQVAQAESAATIDGGHVLAAIAGKQRRSELLSNRLRRLIAEGTLHVATSGTVIGQVNGLAVYQAGNFAFGTPLRISCRVSPGRQGVVAIERETERSGAIHTKGVLVLSGFLAGTFGKERPLTFSASLTFEQSYDEVEGDSASSAELYAILTALADVPVNQSIAATGSVDQFGNIQAVGGITEKIEGFYDLCAEVGLTGEQGVVIPATNVRSLNLRPDVVQAVEEGRFSVWSVSRVEDGIELLTGLPAGELDNQGLYPVGSVFARAVARLTAMHAAASPPTATE